MSEDQYLLMILNEYDRSDDDDGEDPRDEYFAEDEHDRLIN